MSKLQPRRTTVNSIRTSQRPRVTRKRLTSQVLRAWLLRPWAPYRKAEMPARKMKVGAQKCVSQRVMNSAASVTSRGLKPPLAKKSRVWSSAITIKTKPRSVSMEFKRVRAPAAARAVADAPGETVSGNAVRRDVSSARVMTRYPWSNVWKVRPGRAYDPLRQFAQATPASQHSCRHSRKRQKKKWASEKCLLFSIFRNAMARIYRACGTDIPAIHYRPDA